MSEDSVFHSGERAVQERAGEAAIANRNGTLMSDTMITGARDFISKQFMVAVGSIGAQGQVWASMLIGKPGFLHTDSGKSILVEVSASERDETDPIWKNIASNPNVGMLFIELGTRRRYRVNGKLIANHGHGIEIGIREAYPNCPKYIQRRHLRHLGAANLPISMTQGTFIKGSVEAIVRQADTLFVASHHPEAGSDVSHRGGAAGFISLLGEDSLRIPDYHGNSLFNTLGNFAINPRAGLCIPDFAGNRLLQLTGTVTLHWDMEDPANQTGGTGRFWDFKIETWVLRDTPQRLEWEYLDPSPFNLPVIQG